MHTFSHFSGGHVTKLVHVLYRPSLLTALAEALTFVKAAVTENSITLPPPLAPQQRTHLPAFILYIYIKKKSCAYLKLLALSCSADD